MRRARQLPAVQLTARSLCDLELLSTGAFSPVDRFMGSEDYRHVLGEMRLADGTLFPIPLTLPLDLEAPPGQGQEIALRSHRNELLAIMRVEEVFRWDLDEEARAVLGTTDPRHPLVAEMHGWGRWYVSGSLLVVGLPTHHDFVTLRLTPAQVRARLQELGRENVVAFQTRNPIHRIHQEITRRAIEVTGGVLLVHPAIGLTSPGDIDTYTRIRSYRTLVEGYYDRSRTLLALVPLAMRMAGPREAVWHAIIRRNHGANHLVVGRDHSSPGRDSRGQLFFPPSAAQELAKALEGETGVKILDFPELVYLPEEDDYLELDRVPAGKRWHVVSGSEVRESLRNGDKIPSWVMAPEVSALIERAYPPRSDQGFAVWFTGLSAAGKSSIAEILVELLLEHGRQSTLLDGDVVRTHLSRGLGFTRPDREANLRRIGFVTSEIVRHRGAVICAAVSPYRATRNEVRAMIGDERFFLVYVDTPMGVCEARDPKGLYRRARRGEIPNFTGISDPYEPPVDPELVLTTTDHTPAENANIVLQLLIERGFVTK